jgi:hypothetical protein
VTKIGRHVLLFIPFAFLFASDLFLSRPASAQAQAQDIALVTPEQNFVSGPVLLRSHSRAPKRQ